MNSGFSEEAIEFMINSDDGKLEQPLLPAEILLVKRLRKEQLPKYPMAACWTYAFLITLTLSDNNAW